MYYLGTSNDFMDASNTVLSLYPTTEAPSKSPTISPSELPTNLPSPTPTQTPTQTPNIPPTTLPTSITQSPIGPPTSKCEVGCNGINNPCISITPGDYTCYPYNWFGNCYAGTLDCGMCSAYIYTGICLIIVITCVN